MHLSKKTYCHDVNTTLRDLQIQCNPYQNSTGLFCRNRKGDFWIHMKLQGAANSQKNLEKEEESRKADYQFQNLVQNHKQCGTGIRTDLWTNGIEVRVYK